MRVFCAGVASIVVLAWSGLADASEDPRLQGREPAVGLMISNVTGVEYERTAIYTYGDVPLGASDARWIMRRESYPTRQGGVKVAWAGSRDCPGSKAVIAGILSKPMISDMPTIDGGAVSIWRTVRGRAEEASVDWAGETELSRFATDALRSLQQCRWRSALRRISP